MEYVNLGRTGLMVSKLCLGCMSFGDPKIMPWVMEEAESRPFFRRALDAGINFFDTANAYSRGASEVITGRALIDFAGRDNVVIATKVQMAMGPGPNDQGLSRRHIMASIDASLKRLGTDYVDLFIIHRADPGTPEEETLDALNDVVRAGKARYLGASNLAAYRLVRMHQTQIRKGWAKFVNYQIHYNLIYREEERENIPYCAEEGIGLTTWSPTARSWLTGAKRGATTRSELDPLREVYGKRSDDAVIARVVELAARRGVKPAQIAIAWPMHKPGVVAPVIGVTKMYQLDEAIAALDVKLSAEELAWLEEPYERHEIVGHVARIPPRPAA